MIQALKQNIAKLESQNFEIELVENNDIPKCEVCHEPTAIAIKIFGVVKLYPCICKCKRDKIALREKNEDEIKIHKKLEKFRRYSIMDEDFYNCTFERFKIDKQNEKLYKLGIQYCKKWDKIFAENKGLLIYGATGNGKTFLSSCIANELIKQKISVLAMSSIGILKRIQESYKIGYGQETETDIIQVLKEASLLVIDDLGAEYRAVNKDWVEKTLYSIIDSRYRSKKPIIITTNLTPENLEKALISADGINRTYDRLKEMVAFIKISGGSKREQLGGIKHNQLLELLEL